MEPALSAIAAAGASAFAVDLARSYRRRPRAHVGLYALGMAMFAIATWALFVGVTWDWNGFWFRTFYLFGGLLNIPVLALGSVFLVLGARVGRIAAAIVAVFSLVGTYVVVREPFVGALPSSGIPEGSEVFAWPGPRVWAALGGGVGALVLLALALYSVWRFRQTNRRMAGANVLIAVGVFAATAGGTLTALGEAGGLAVALWWRLGSSGSATASSVVQQSDGANEHGTSPPHGRR